ncbi:TolC family outer membrane protein [Novosphingobium sp. KCTC 2891]|uniref:TolC family outer membrane protein n=1 Tax=Novosphingobium sp. KCTC 2891 TaxID=2989730 RepID=UPI002223564B|nr:TolC family outer membrane protein [Novosphingobium sp. KCTC 2891]MCW1381308.1 TolC family outer membrane protein [Novosphingobium sp. KCTC 2891]
MRRTLLPFLLAASALIPAASSAQDSTAVEDREDGLPISVSLPDGTPADVAEAATAGAAVTALPDALRRAYWTSPTLLAQRSAVKSVDYRVPQARAAYGPKLDFELTYGLTRSGTLAPGNGWNDGTARSATASAILTQPLFTFGRNAAAERFALAQLAYQRQVLRSSEQQAMLDAITSYVGLLRDRASVAIARDNLDTLERELSDNRARFAGREVTSTDVQQVETRVELGRAQVYTAQRDAAASEATFLRMIGGPAGTLAAPNPLRLPVETLEQAYGYAEGHNPVLLAAQQREKVSRASLASAKADLMPRVDLRGQADYSKEWNPPSVFNQTGRQDLRDLRGQVIISGPIYESGLRQARVGEASAANDADWRLIDASLRENRATLASAWDDWKAQSAAIERFAGAVSSAKSAYEGALLQEKAGLRTTLDVIDLARELLQARSNYNAAIAGAYVAQARVLAAMGALEQSWLLPDAPRYNVESHYNDVRHNGDVPLLTPLIRAIDGAPLGSKGDRPLRDPAAPLTTPAVKIDPVREIPVP